MSPHRDAGQPAPMQARLGVLLFGLPGAAGLLSPISAPDVDVALVCAPSLASIVIAALLWRRRHSLPEAIYLPLMLLGLAFDGMGLVATHATARMAMVFLPALLWGSHYLVRRRQMALVVATLGAVYAAALAVEAPRGVPLVGQWIFTMSYLTIAAVVTYVSGQRLQALLAESHEASRVDALTGLGNRRRLLADLDERAADEQYVLALLDLNGFKAYNDRNGHLAGDAVLRELGSRFSAAVTGLGAAYRLGGDEFCAVLDDAHPAGAAVTAVAQAFAFELHGCRIDAAWGTAQAPEDGTSAAALLAVADERMYAHKRAQRQGPVALLRAS